MRRKLLSRAITWGCALTALGAVAAERGVTAQGWPFVSGGSNDEELVALHQRKDEFNLWVVTAARRSGAFLADVRISITDAQRRVVLEHVMAGPWLFVRLPLGRYEVQAQYRGPVQRRTTTIHQGDLHQVFFYFDTGDDVSPDRQPPFKGSPYGGDKKGS